MFNRDIAYMIISKEDLELIEQTTIKLGQHEFNTSENLIRAELFKAYELGHNAGYEECNLEWKEEMCAMQERKDCE